MTILACPPSLNLFTHVADQARKSCEKPDDLSQVICFMPTRRACRLLESTFLATSPDNATLLPKIMPLGDPDLEQLPQKVTSLVFNTIPSHPTASDAYQQLVLAQALVSKFPFAQQHSFSSQLSLSKELLSFYEQVTTQGLDPASITATPLDGSNLLNQQRLTFLTIFLNEWPAILHHHGLVDRGTYRRAVLQSLAAYWQEMPPTTPVLSTVSAGLIPPAMDLLSVLKNCDMSQIFIHGAPPFSPTQDMPKNHPFSYFSTLVQRLGNDDVVFSFESNTSQAARAQYVATVIDNQTIDPLKQEAFDGVSLTEFDTPEDEAQFIALKMRLSLLEPKKKTALVTPDRTLAKRVQAHLARWEITVDDSAGVSLSDIPSIGFALEALRILRPIQYFDQFNAFALSPYLDKDYRFSRESLLKIRAKWRKQSFLTDLLQTADVKKWQDPISLLKHVKFTHHEPPSKWVSFALKWLKSIVMPSIWTEEAITPFLETLTHLSTIQTPVTFTEFVELLANACTQQSFRTPKGDHPRLFILGLREARMIQVDEVILSGLNEGIWPGKPTPNLWQYSSLQHQLDLPTDDVKIGHDGFDFWLHLCGCARACLTRTKKDVNGATLPSRWLDYLRLALKSQNYTFNTETEILNQLSQLQSHTPLTNEPILPPMAQLGQENWPNKISISQVNQLIHDPYLYYLNSILKIAPLPDIEDSYTALDFGILIHKTIEDFTKFYDAAEDPIAAFMRHATRIFKTKAPESLNNPFWAKRIKRLAKWIAPKLSNQLAKATYSYPEQWAEMPLRESEDLVLYGKIDRADLLISADQTVLEIADYKSGFPPSKNEVITGKNIQLPLEAELAAHILKKEGKLSNTTYQQHITYWHLHYLEPKIISFSDQETRESCVAANAQLSMIAKNWRNPAYHFTPTQNVSNDDFLPLTRQPEWEAI